MAETISRKTVEVLTIMNPGDGLDPIEVIFMDHDLGRGRVIVRCYMQAWTAWWGAMGERNTVRSFFMSCDEQYLAGYLIQGQSDLMLARKREKQEAYIQRIVRAIQRSMLAEALE